MKNISGITDACPFCGSDRLDIVEQRNTAFAVFDTSPVTEGHLLIIPKRHCCDYFELNKVELWDCHRLIATLRHRILKKDPRVDGFNIGANCGESAGQTIFHMHIHLIPRRKNDTPRPRGGVRGVIPEKMNYEPVLKAPFITGRFS